MFHLPSSIKVIEQNKNFGKFEIEGLYPGYGVTIGNALRRVLLSSIEGAAVTSFRIAGLPHEFSSIPHVLETGVDIMLNLKQLRVKLLTDEPQILHLSVKGEKKVTAADFDSNPLVEILNPDLHLATLTSPKASLEMEVKVEKGLGYVMAEERKQEKLPVGTIAVDALFSPVLKVNFWVENMRVGKRTDYNRLFITIQTDGSLLPQEALVKAAIILEDHFAFIREKVSLETEMSKDVKKKTTISPKDITIDELDLSTRTKKALQNNGIKTLAGLLRYREENLAKLDGLGKKSLEEIKKILKDLQFTLK